jgi:hypothetical protein
MEGKQRIESSLQGCPFNVVVARCFYRNESVWIQSRTRAKLFRIQTNGFVQHLEPRACVRNNSVLFPPQMRSVKKIAVRAAGGFDSDHDMQEGDNMSADLSSASFGC